MHKLIVAALAFAFAPLALSQASEPVTRASVKAETRVLEKAGDLAPAGEGRPRSRQADSRSTLTRSERKTATRLAAKNHELAPAGSGGAWKADDAIRARPTTRSRAERKAETRLAQKEHKLAPAGERNDAARN